MRPRTIDLLWAASGILAAVAIAVTVHTVRTLGATRERLDARLATAAALRVLAGEQAAWEACRRKLDAVPGAKAVKLETILRSALAGAAPEDVRDTAEELEAPWRLRRKEVVLGDLPLERVLAAVRQAAAQRPPWRLAECRIEAAPATPGRGRAVLVFETLEKKREGGNGAGYRNL